MHTFTKHHAILFALGIAVLALSTQAAAGTITVTNPEPGEILYAGETLMAQWDYLDVEGNVNVYLYNNWTKLSKLVTQHVAMNTYYWPIPSDQPAGNLYRIRVQSVTNPAITDYGDPFAIAAPTPTIQVTSPNGGEVWNVGDLCSIEWTSAGLWGNANLWLYNNWTKLRKLNTVPIQNGIWMWTPQAGEPASNTYRIRVQSVVDPAYNDYSNATFTITAPPSLHVTMPNGGESWVRGSAYAIGWESTGLWGNMNILLYKNWTKIGIIGTAPIHAGSWTWNIPGNQALLSTYRIRVQSLLNTAYNDYSDALFQIAEGANTIVSIPAGTFTMGNSGAGDDVAYGDPSEQPQHPVELSAYEIGQYEVTNYEYCAVLNWALAQGRLTDFNGDPYAGGDVYSMGEVLLVITGSYCLISYEGGQFVSQMRDGYSMATHPVCYVSWYGAALYCNWLSEMNAMTPCYNTSTWALNRAAGGYHLPTEAQWERAAAWDGLKHWVYGFSSDTLTGKNRCNYMDVNPEWLNPLGLTGYPYTSPVGWFNGTNISPNGNIQTLDSVSPVGGYDMSGGVAEWCNDWFGSYSSAYVSNPEGPGTGEYRVYRGGSWEHSKSFCRSAWRGTWLPSWGIDNGGFRVARY